MKLVLGIAAALGIAAVAYGAAAQLIVNGGALQSGTAANLVCDEDGVSLSYTLDGENNLEAATVSDIDAACVGAGLTMVIHATPEEGGDPVVVPNDCSPKEIVGDETAADAVECVLETPYPAEGITSINISIVSSTAPEPTTTPEPTEVPTETPTEVPTETPTEEPTEVPTEVPTEEPGV